MSKTEELQPSEAGGGSFKRARTAWDVDVSLEKLVSWDVLEQFMQDIPSESSVAEHGLGDSLLGAMGRGAIDGTPNSSSHFQAVSQLGPGPGAGDGPESTHSLGSCWHRPGSGLSVQSLGQSWSADFQTALPSNCEQETATSGASVEQEAGIAAGGDGGRQVHKQRFVWTAELHRCFEAAVNTLGIDHAKPQAISQLMNCEGDGAPTRQNIKSHLQKYRLLMSKRGKAGGGSMTMTPSASCASLVDQDEPVEEGVDACDPLHVKSEPHAGARLGWDAASVTAEQEKRVDALAIYAAESSAAEGGITMRGQEECAEENEVTPQSFGLLSLCPCSSALSHLLPPDRAQPTEPLILF
jgi:SHAQKYF class myb-like DNA-binding protein